MIFVDLIKIGEQTALGIKLEVSNAPILILRGEKGLLTCGYFNVDVADRIGDAIAVVTNVKNFDEMLTSKVVAVSKKAEELGIKIGDSGKDALMKLL